jgi:L-iditol 2-dehydrogenase
VPGLIEVCKQAAPVVLYTSYHGGMRDDVDIDLNKIHYSEVKLVGTVSPKIYDFYRAVKLVSDGRFKLDKLVEEIYPFEQIQQAFEHGIRPGAYRVVLDIGLGIKRS